MTTRCTVIFKLLLFYCLSFITTTIASIHSFPSILSSASNEFFYVYDWPNITYTIPVNGREVIAVYTNYGAGKVINASRGSYGTDQFRLYSLMFHRALNDPRRTLNPENATTFLIPYDLARDAVYKDIGAYQKIKCSNGRFVIDLLSESPYFQRKLGRDHILIMGLNYAMDYFIMTPPCKSLLLKCSNCTKFAIDDYSFMYANNSGVQIKGDYWHAVPFPSNFHWTSQVQRPFLWEYTNRPILVSYIGSVSSHWNTARMLRTAISMFCKMHTNDCIQQSYASNKVDTRQSSLNESNGDPHQLLSMRSTFCFVPLGDMPTRKGLFDVIAHGCIPVTFDALTARIMYTWHWPEQLWKDILIELPMNHQRNVTWRTILLDDPVKYLKDYLQNNPTIVLEKQRLLRQHAFELQYAIEKYEEGDNSTWPMTPEGIPQKDAYGIAMDLAMGWHSGRLIRFRNATVTECWGKGRLVDNVCIW